MAARRSSVALLSAATVLLCGCGPSGGGAPSRQAAAGSAPPAVSSASAAPSDTAASTVAASALPPVAAEPPPAPARIRPAAAAAPREPTPAELLRNDPAYIARGRRLDAAYQNARERDPTGQVDQEQAAALAELHACPDRACLDRWFNRREAALREYVGN